MYNGIGLPTPRGSGTSGYIQANKFHLKPRPGKAEPKEFQNGQGAGGVTRKANKEILEHDRKRRIELKLTLLEDSLVEQGYTDEEILERVEEKRKILEAETENDNEGGEFGDAVRVSETQTHQIAAKKERQLETMKAALRISDTREGEAFDRELQEQRKQERIIAREQEEKERRQQQLELEREERQKEEERKKKEKEERAQRRRDEREREEREREAERKRAEELKTEKKRKEEERRKQELELSRMKVEQSHRDKEKRVSSRKQSTRDSNQLKDREREAERREQDRGRRPSGKERYEGEMEFDNAKRASVNGRARGRSSSTDSYDELALQPSERKRNFYERGKEEASKSRLHTRRENDFTDSDEELMKGTSERKRKLQDTLNYESCKHRQCEGTARAGRSHYPPREEKYAEDDVHAENRWGKDKDDTEKRKVLHLEKPGYQSRANGSDWREGNKKARVSISSEEEDHQMNRGGGKKFKEQREYGDDKARDLKTYRDGHRTREQRGYEDEEQRDYDEKDKRKRPRNHRNYKDEASLSDGDRRTKRERKEER